MMDEKGLSCAGFQDQIACTVHSQGADQRRQFEASHRPGEQGLIDADLGGGLVKQRVARQGQGRSGGFRMLIAFRHQGRAVFLYGFAKNERDNIEPDELLSLREIAAGWLAVDTERIAAAVVDGALQEIDDDQDA